MTRWIKQGVLALLAVAVMGGVIEARAQEFDRLQKMVEPVKGKKKYRIAYASADMNAAFWLGMTYGLIDEAKHADIEVVRVLSAGGYGNVAQQIGQLESLGALNLDAVIIAGAAYDGFDKPVERLVEKGTKVIAMGAPISSAKVSLGIIQNESGLGATLAKWICDRDAEGTIVTLPGPPGSEWNRMRFEGFKAEAAKSCPKAKLVGNTYAGNIGIEDGQTQASDLLVKNPQAKYMYVVAGIMAVGAAQAGRRLNHPAKVVTGTLAHNTAALVKEGRIEMVVSEPSILFGRAATQYTVRLLNGDPTPNLIPGILPYPVFLVPNQVLTKEKLEKYDLTWYDLPPEGWKPPQLQ
ncbi:MAG: hypothetical protein EXQ91_06860 [Alphaproteobacteria bacterium]|nr:hypothetical protein [Alphaproteobacteria bacterium]